ncbi:Uroporphyrinogen-III methylase (siroheme synthase) [Luteibacter sp. UNCMF331Sha3.1]|uniref:SAM-dependent methyltransferase n=1 Tax=Luteibacter sp. UNCMF331Sha3.1 TaxID=1502760 RepID=UPI0008C98369|nr:SAM-dependent methyltransferase [Luteibacter sp. UNCMF331Sha3.1]SEN16952.1 Uroporphyrinogen-III methylase (siroheme synthase) [Luteibacter sp. UNCMF331Sha3.1]
MNTTDPHATPPRGYLSCVGMGMTLGSHLTPLARSHIQKADVVFAAVSDALVEAWVRTLHPDVRSLQPYYREGRSRMHTYREWVALLMGEVRAGRRVCGVFYGHPGIFAWSPHKAIAMARAEGFDAHMEPGISAEDCLYADLGIDPGRFGCQHLEASQLVFFERRIDTGGYLVLWQAGAVGDRTMTRFETGAAYRQVLVDVLLEDYPPEHEIVVYRAPTLPVQSPRIRRALLTDLATMPLTAEETVVLPPASTLKPNARVAARLTALDAAAGFPGDA